MLLVVLIRLWPRDQWVVTALIYYATPWFLLAAGSLLVQFLRKSRAWLGVSCLLFLTGFLTLRGPGSISEEGAWHLRLWNAQNPTDDQEEILTRMLAGQPDVVVATDSGPLAHWIKQQDALHGTAYTPVFPGGGFLFLVKSPLTLEEVHLIRFQHPHSRLGVGTLRFPDDRQLSLVAVEMDYDPRRSKRALFTELEEALVDLKSPLLLAGDFNVPPGSVWLEGLGRNGLRSAFRERGRGLEASWPAGFPLLGIDQIWSDSTIRIHSARYGQAYRSDHRKLDVYMSLNGEDHSLRHVEP